MPSLKQLICSIEKGTDNIPLTEYNTTYADGLVTSYIRVPSQSTSFSIHLTSSGYIAPGLAMFVFMDGVPQCNRNRRGLVIPDGITAASETKIDFRVRQKEDKFDDRRFIGREWTFEGLNITGPDKVKGVDKDVLKSVGTIEVVVLRCHGDVRAIANDKRSIVRHATSDGVVDLGGQLDGASDGTPQAASFSRIGGLDGANDNPWAPSPSVPERFKHLDGRKKSRKPGGSDPLAGLDQAFQRQSISGYAPPNVDGAGSQYPVQPPAWPAYHQSPHAYQYPPFWTYHPYYGPPPRPYSSGRSPRQTGAGAREWAPMWAQPKKEGSQAGGNGANDGDDDAKSNVRATSMVSDAKSDKGRDEENNGWNEGHHEQQNGGLKQSNQDSSDNGWENQAAGDSGNNWDSNNNDQPADNTWNQDSSNDQNNGWNDTGNQDNAGNGWENTNNNQDQANNNDVGDKNWNAPDTSKDQAIKSSPSKKYKHRRQHRHSHHSHDGASDHSASKPSRAHSHIKPYWSQWAQPSNLSADNNAASTSASASTPGNRDPYLVPAEPLQPIPRILAEKGDLTHQVRAGRGKLYYHSTGTPRYIDTMTAPYAVFIFKYRSQEALERILPGVKIKKDVLPLEARWKKMNEEERLAYMLKLQAKVGSSDESSSDDDSGRTSDDSTATATTKKSAMTVKSVRSIKSARSVKSAEKSEKNKRKAKKKDKKEKSSGSGSGGGNGGEDWSGGGENNNDAGDNWSGSGGGNNNNGWDSSNNNDTGGAGWENNNAGDNQWGGGNDAPAADAGQW